MLRHNVCTTMYLPFPYPEDSMNTLVLSGYLHLRDILAREEGQDLVEYALVVALIAFGAIAGMGLLATGINNAFSGIATTLTANV
jgi:pilus assembly protein Flp/PilA